MQRQSETGRPNENRERRLDARTVLLHHRHVSNGRKRDKERCGFCAKGLEGIAAYPEVRPEKPEDSVAEDSGGDEEGPTTPAPGSREYWQ